MSAPSGSKTCMTCGEVKALAVFHRDPRMKDGRINGCAACQNDRVRERHAAWQRANPERCREYARRSREKNKRAKEGDTPAPMDGPKGVNRG